MYIGTNFDDERNYDSSYIFRLCCYNSFDFEIKWIMSNYTDLVSKIGKETSRSACKKCGYAGHLTFQCRNFIKVRTL